MQMKAGLVFVLLGVMTLAGCATGKSEEAPVDDKAGTAGTDGAGGAAGERLGAIGETDLLAKKRVHFAFDSTSLDVENRAVVEAHAAHVAANPGMKVHLEGHGDERGTREYNLALGERRAQAVENVMRALGVGANRITTASYGEEKPLSPERSESGWQMNRRVEIIYK